MRVIFQQRYNHGKLTACELLFRQQVRVGTGRATGKQRECAQVEIQSQRVAFWQETIQGKV